MSETNTVHRSMIQRALLGLIKMYRRAVSPLLPPACRFYPSCSEYASEAIATHGPARGLKLAAARVARCHPGCEGGLDPVPPRGRPTHAHVVTSAMKGRA